MAARQSGEITVIERRRSEPLLKLHEGCAHSLMETTPSKVSTDTLSLNRNHPSQRPRSFSSRELPISSYSFRLAVMSSRRGFDE
jgi:hypothetical protein